jgi:hypothetical protein
MEQKVCAVISSTNLSENVLILRKIKRNIITKVQMP